MKIGLEDVANDIASAWSPLVDICERLFFLRFQSEQNRDSSFQDDIRRGGGGLLVLLSTFNR
jgi:hypothetical protein